MASSPLFAGEGGESSQIKPAQATAPSVVPTVGGQPVTEEGKGSQEPAAVESNRSFGKRRFGFPQWMRLKRPAEFERCFACKRSAADSVLIVYVCENQLPYPRLGCVVSRKCGRAVRRNRYKRLLREAFRLLQYELPAGIDYVVLPRPGEPLPTLEAVRRSLLRLGRLAVRRLREPPYSSR